MKLHIYKDEDEMSSRLAHWMCTLIDTVLKEQEYFTLAISGGETPKALFKKLASKDISSRINWKRIHIFWGDERVVPFNDERNNAKAAYDLLINHIDIPAGNVHIMRTDTEPNFAVDAYRKMLRTFFDNASLSFDLVLLGMGNDGHTLSLFPGSPIIEDHKYWVNSVYSAKQKMFRITLMPDLVNRASNVVFMVSGKAKAITLHKVIEGEYTPSKLPAQIIKPQKGELHWFLDEDAAGKLRNK